MANGTLKGAWNYVTVVCGNHGDEYTHEMELHNTETKITYECPICKKKNEIPYWTYESMLLEITDMLVKAEANNNVINLTNYEWRKNGVLFKVISHSDKNIVVSLVNIK